MKNKKSFAALAAVVLLAALIGVLSGCTFLGGGGSLSVTIDAAGGVLTSKEVYEAKSGGDFYLDRLSVPTREGYTFVGWQCGDKMYSAEAVLKVTSDITLKAVWKRDEGVFLLTFDRGGGAPQVVSVPIGDSYLLSDAQEPVRAGYRFLGWKNGGVLYLKEDENVFYPERDTTFTAEWEAIEYTVTFKNGDVVVSTATYRYGDAPAIPDFDDEKLPKTANVSNTETKVFKSWSSPVVPVTEDAVYQAVYEIRNRVYTLGIASKGVLLTDEKGAAIEKISGLYDAYFEFKIALSEGVRLNGDEVVRVNGTVLTPDANGVYSVRLSSDGMELTVDNLEYVKFDAVFQLTDAYAEAAEGYSEYGIVYGDAFEFKVRGAAGFEKRPPNIRYYSNLDNLYHYLEPAGQDGNGWYLYRIENIRETLTIKVSGANNPIYVTYIDAEDNRIESVVYDMSDIGDFDDDPILNAAMPAKVLKGEDGSYPYKASFRYLLTPDEEKRFTTKEEYQAWNDDWQTIPDYVIEPDVENVFYIVYYKWQAEYDMSVTTAGTVEGSFDGGSTWETLPRLEYEANTDLQPRYEFWATYGTEVRLRISGLETLPSLVAGEKRLNANAAGEYVFTTTEEVGWTAEMKYHTVTLPPVGDDMPYYIYDKHVNEYVKQSFQVADGADFYFRVVFRISEYSLKDRDNFVNYVRVNGVTPQPQGISPYSSIIYYDYFVENVTEDVVITVDPPKPNKVWTLRFAKVDGFDIYLNDQKLEFAAGETYKDVTIDLTEQWVYSLVPAEGYEFAKDGKLEFYYRKLDYVDGAYTAAIKTSSRKQTLGTNSASPFKNAKSVILNNIAASYSYFVEATDEDATEKQKLFKVYTLPATRLQTVKAEQFTLRSDPTELGAVFTKAPATTAEIAGSYSLSIQVPAGNVPKLYVEWADKFSEGFLAYAPIGVSGNTYSFEIVKPRANFRWYILLETETYQVDFRWGEDGALTLDLPHGAPVGNIALPTSYQGVKDGVEGIYTILYWKHADGTRFLTVNGAETVTPETEFKPSAASFNGVYYTSVADAIAALNPSSVGNLDILYGATGENAETLKAGTAETPAMYTIPAGVTLRLPFRAGEYGYYTETDKTKTSALYADQSLGTVALIVPEFAELKIYGTVEIGAQIGYPGGGSSYQGHVSGNYAILKLDGKAVVESGGKFAAYGYVEGAGSIDVRAGGKTNGAFVVRDFRGGTNSSGVYYEKIAPFNVYEMPNFLVTVTLESGAVETAEANLFALGGYNVMTIDVLGGTGLIRHAEGGKIVKKTTRIENPRYTDAAKGYEPRYEFRTRIDVYGGGNDGILSLDGIVKTEGIPMALNFAFDIHLYDGEYVQGNIYKIMPGGKLTVEKGATLSIQKGDVAMGTMSTYPKTFKDNLGGQSSGKVVLYPAIAEDGLFVVNGTLNVYGKIGGEIKSTAAGAEIFSYSPITFLYVDQAEGAAYPGFTFVQTYSNKAVACVTSKDGILNLEMGGYYRSEASDSGFVWVKL